MMLNGEWGYRDQAYANIIAFLTQPKFLKRLEVLKKLVIRFTEAGITFRFAFSFVLFLLGLVDDFNDFDILVARKDLDKLKEVLRDMGAEIISTSQKGVFSSPYYQEAILDGVHLDIIVDIEINTFGTMYRYEVKEEEKLIVNLDGNICVPLVPMEANFILYGKMVGWQLKRKFKEQLCLDFLQKTGLKFPSILIDALKNFKLHPDLKEETEKLLLVALDNSSLPMNLRKEVEELLALQ